MPKFSNTASKKSPSRNKSHSRTIRINNATSGRLPTIRLQLPGRPGLRFLVDSGAGINLLKQRCYPGRATIPNTKKFSMGHSEYESNSNVKLNLFDKKGSTKASGASEQRSQFPSYTYTLYCHAYISCYYLILSAISDITLHCTMWK